MVGYSGAATLRLAVVMPITRTLLALTSGSALNTGITVICTSPLVIAVVIGPAPLKGTFSISTPAIDMLTSYHWPGNVRELENTIERAVLVCDGGVVHAHHLPPTLQTAEASDTVPRQSLAESVEAFEKDLIADALKTTRGNRARASKLLSTTERIFNYKVRKYRISADRFRD